MAYRYRLLVLFSLCCSLALLGIPLASPAVAQEADEDEEVFSLEEGVEMPEDDTPRPVGAPAPGAPAPGGRTAPGGRPRVPVQAPPPPQGYFGRFSNDMGKFDLHGPSGTAQYHWYDDQFHDDDLVLVRSGAMPGYDSNNEEQLHHGWVYRVAGARFWIFFSKTAVGSRNRAPIYPLYYSFSSSRSGFKRWLSSSGTRYRPPQRPALLNDMDEAEEGELIESRE